MREDSILIKEHVVYGQTVSNGFGESTAPNEAGLYSLYEKYDSDTNQHISFVWIKENEENIFRKLRLRTNMTMSDFAHTYQIPIRTLEDWETNKHMPPSYVYYMLNRIVNEDLENK